MDDVAVAVMTAAAEGTDVAFGIPGTHCLPLFAAAAAAGIRVVGTRHEQAAAYAADAYARLGGRPGLVLTTTGPGAVNAATGMAQAWSDSSPVLLVAPGPPLHPVPGSTGRLHQMPDQFASVRACVGTAVRAGSAAAAVAAVRGFQQQARHGRPRPWYLEIPLDVLAGRVAPGTGVPGPDAPADPEPGTDARQAAAIAQAAGLLAGARFPVVVAGGGSRGAGGALRQVVERLGAPVLTTAAGRGVLPEEHPLCLGAALPLPAGREVLAAADVLLVVGSELGESDTWVDDLPVPHTVVRVDVDPSMADANLPAGGPRSCFLPGRAETVLPGLLDALNREADAGRPPAGADTGDRAPLRTAVTDARDRVRAQAQALARPWAGLLAGLRAGVPPEAVVVTDTTQVAYDAALGLLPVGPAGRYLAPTGFGTLGWAVPAAVGCLSAEPGRPVLVLTGDGGLQFGLAELGTLAQTGAPVPVVLVDNGGYGEIRDRMADRGDPPLAVDPTGPHWPDVAAAHGLRAAVIGPPAHRPECAADACAAVRAALAADRPTMIVVRQEIRP